MEDLCKERLENCNKNYEDIKKILVAMDTKLDDFLVKVSRMETQIKVLWWFFTIIGGSIVSIITGLIKF